MKPKCFSEAGLPPHLIASKLICTFRNDTDEDKMTADLLGARRIWQSLCLCIAVFFLLKSELHSALVTQDTRDFRQLPGRETLRGASNAVVLFLCSGLFCSGFYLRC